MYKFQGVVSADRVIIHLDGPYCGPEHDITMYQMSLLEQLLQQHSEQKFRGPHSLILKFCLLPAFSPNSETLHIYSDPGYIPGTPHCIVPCKVVNPMPAQAVFNHDMSGVRISIEWAQDKLANEWAFLNSWRNLKIHLSPIALHYKIGVLLSNCRSCLYGSKMATKFSLTAPFWKCT